MLNLLPENCGRVLDVACGQGEWGFLLKVRQKCSYLVGVDVWDPYLDALGDLKVYDRLIHSQLPKLPRFVGPFDTIMAMEILEHLNPEDGHILLANIEQMTKKNGLMVVSTPMNLRNQGAIDNNPFQRHISEWTPNDLEALGYKVKKIRKYPRSLLFADRIRRIIFRMPMTPLYLVATKIKP